MSVTSPTAIASAPPEPPSPMTVQMIGHPAARPSRRDCGRSPPTARAPRRRRPGYAPGVSTNVNTGMPNFSASFISRSALRIALGLGHAEVAVDLLLGVAPLLVPDHHAALAVEAREPADDRRVVGERAVAVQLLETGEEPVRCSRACTAAADGARPARSATRRACRRCPWSAPGSSSAAARSPRRCRARNRPARSAAPRSSPRARRSAARIRGRSFSCRAMIPQSISRTRRHENSATLNPLCGELASCASVPSNASHQYQPMSARADRSPPAPRRSASP